MRDFVGQIREVLQNSRLYYAALFISLTLPDICGAIGSENGEASRQKYINWYNKYASDSCKFLTGEDCYLIRCSILHQGSTQHPKGKYNRIVFVEPSATTNVFHCNILNDALNLDVHIFCENMIQGVETWLKENENTELYQNNYDRLIRRYPKGLKPYIVGVPVIS
jgi:hypothetical protein